MTTFILVAALMASVALGLVVWPLYRGRAADGRAALVVIGVIAVLLPVAAGLLYKRLSNWSWDPAVLEAAAAPNGQHSLTGMVGALEARLQKEPGNVDGWMMLGRSMVVMNNYPRAVSAYEQAYKLSSGKNVEAVVGYGEALALVEQSALTGRAGQLFEEALKLDARNPKALYYAGASAALGGHFDVAREHWAELLKQELPEEIRRMVAQHVMEADQQLGRKPDAFIAKLAAAPQPGAAPMAGPMGGDGAAQGAAPQPAADVASGPGVVTVHVKLSPALAAKVPAGAPLFVLARDPTQPGPPFGAKRFPGASLPMDVKLTEQDAMMPARTIKTAKQLVIVARFSTSGMPTASSGDVYGEVPYDLGKGAPVDLVMDKQVP